MHKETPKNLGNLAQKMKERIVKNGDGAWFEERSCASNQLPPCVYRLFTNFPQVFKTNFSFGLYTAFDFEVEGGGIQP